LPILEKDIPHLRALPRKTPDPTRAQKVIAVRYKRVPHTCKTARPPKVFAFHHLARRLDLKRRLPMEDGRLRHPPETMLRPLEIKRPIELA
jgi:hypothetical protein